MTESLLTLADLHGRYDALFCDIWGVIHNGHGPYPGAVPALQAARAAGLKVVLISNVPKPRDPIPGQLDRLGVPRDAWDSIVTSGDAIRAEIRARAPGPAFCIGHAGDRVLWADLGLEEVPFEAAAMLVVAGIDHADQPDAVARATPMLEAARARQLPFLCANPDRQVRVGSQLIWCAGALADAYSALGGEVILAGKPHAPIYALARAEVPGVPDARILAIGDGISTDVLGADREGLDCLFIAGGLLGDGLMEAGTLDLVKVSAALTAAGTHAQYVMAGLG